MRQRGRKSGANMGILQVDGKPNRLNPPTSLSAAERAIFFDVVAACDRDHFRPSDLPLLVRYVEAAALGDQAAEQLRLGAVINGKPSPWITVQEKAVRAMVALSMRLRLSPQSRIDAKTLGRQEVRQGPAPWEYGDDARR
ncbi:MAG: P27 family phage terminase small subunit [Pseudolabrys sp.]